MREQSTTDPYLMVGHAMAAIWRARLAARTRRAGESGEDVRQLLTLIAGWLDDTGAAEVAARLRDTGTALAAAQRQAVQSLTERTSGQPLVFPSVTGTTARYPVTYSLAVSSPMPVSPPSALSLLDDAEAALRAWLLLGCPAEDIVVPHETRSGPESGEVVIRRDRDGGALVVNPLAGTQAATEEQMEAARERIAAIKKIVADGGMKGFTHQFAGVIDITPAARDIDPDGRTRATDA